MEVCTKFFSAMIFISALLGLMELSDIVVLCGRPKVAVNKTFNVLVCLYYSEVCFHERVAMTIKQT